MWYQLRRENPALLNEFEKVLTSLGEEILRSKLEFEGLEAALRKCVMPLLFINYFTIDEWRSTKKRFTVCTKRLRAR